MWEYYIWFQKQNSHISLAQCHTDEVTLFPGSVETEEWLHYGALCGKEMLFSSQLMFRQLILSSKGMFLIWVF